MEKDSYPRFLKSDIYLNLLNELQANSLKWLAAGKMALEDGNKYRRNMPVRLPEQLALFGWLSRSRRRTNDSEWINVEVVQV